MSKFNIELKIEKTLVVKVEASSSLEAISTIKDRYSKIEVADTLHDANVSIVDIIEDPQMSFCFHEDPMNYQPMLMFG